MKRVLTAALIAFTLAGSARGLPDQVAVRLPHPRAVAATHANRGPCFGPEYEVKHYMTTNRQHRHVRNLLACATDRWSVPGGYSTALRIATCESSLYAWAYSNLNAGLFQIRSWTTRARNYLQKRWFPFHWVPRWQLARANVLTAIVWAHRLGWSAWACS